MFKRRDFIRMSTSMLVSTLPTFLWPLASMADEMQNGKTRDNKAIQLIAEAWQRRQYAPPLSVIASAVQTSDWQTPSGHQALKSAIQENYLHGDIVEVEGFFISKLEAALLLSTF